jgi:hypothetical protein
MTPIFNVVAAYKDDGGVYEWEGEAADHDDAERQAQLQAWEDNCPTAVAEGEAPDFMLAEGEISVIDVTAKHALKAELLAALREEADKTGVASERADYLRDLAQRFESMGTHA